MDIDEEIAEMKSKLMTLLNSEFRDFNLQYDDLNTKGVYAIYDGEEIIYIGESNKIDRRLYEELLIGVRHKLFIKLFGYKNLDNYDDVKNFLLNVCKFKMVSCRGRGRLESFAIGVLKPKFNKLKGRVFRPKIMVAPQLNEDKNIQILVG